MPQRSAVMQLPEVVRSELDRKLITNGFSDYAGLADWLAEQGYEIGKSSIHRYGSKFEERLAALKSSTQQAIEMKNLLGDDEAAVSEMSIQLAQGLMFNLMIERGEDLSPREMALITRALADSSRSSIAVKKYQAEVRDRCEQAAEEAVKVMAKAGVSDETAAEIRAKFLGIAG
jgi:hypothetical protein